MKILVNGSTGLIGSNLVPFLRQSGHDVFRLIRTQPGQGTGDVYWNPAAGEIDKAGLEGFDAVINLAGEPIEGRWTPEKKAKIRDSRVNSTGLLARTLSGLDRPPSVFISVSATGYYGDRGDEILTEDSLPGHGFLSSLCQEWEAATEPANWKGVRVVRFRMGVVLTPKGGALEQMLVPFRRGLGAKLGTGKQYMSWVSLDDVLGAMQHVLWTESINGPVNVVSPNPVTNKEFTKTLSRVLGRFAGFTVPAVALRLMFGEMADEALLFSERVVPQRLKTTGYKFLYPELDRALRHLLTGNGQS